MTIDLEPRKAELVRMGYTVRYEEPGLFVASRSKWHWDCFMTKLSTITLVRRIAHLTPQVIQGDLAALAQRATEYDPSALPGGFQKGRALVAFYCCDTADAAAVEMAKKPPAMDFASFTMSGIVDGAGNQAWYDKTRVWGAVFYSKFHHLMRRLVNPAAPPVGEPLSIPGTSIIAFLFIFFCLAPCFCIIAGQLR